MEELVRPVEGFGGTTRMRGTLTARKIRAKGPGLIWKLKNNLRPSYVKAWIGAKLISPLANLFGIATMYGELSAVLFRADGSTVNYGVICRRVITDAGVAYLVDDWDGGGSDINALDFHGCGTGTTAEAAGDTALETESTTILNPNDTRATGTNSQPAANQFRSVGTLTFDGAGAITEHGILSQAATGGGTLWDRSVFSAINVASGDSIQFTYTCTVSSGG